MMRSPIAAIALINGEPEAMWGFQCSPLGDEAFAWLVISDAVTRLPKVIVKEARYHIALIAERYSELAVTVLPDDETAIRFAVFLGFHDNHDEGKMTHKALSDRIRTNPRHLVPVGDTHVIALGWHR